MKLLIWMVFGLLALMWTAGAFVAAEMAGWAAAVFASGEAENLGRAAAAWPVPEWVALWVDPGLLRAMQQSLLWSLDALRDALPLLGSLLGWLAPLVWIGWGLGLLLMLVLAATAQIAVGRLLHRQARGA
ncbi:hypothetical protein [Caldimonas tepidiphila]|uniref:hypothetical protein n=1 Tax=Caldimonas tepidiphila TaxID=2315841 RepID=UPI000E5B765F|nr:hypothetical protein [Caldimonas tepidiphila]